MWPWNGRHIRFWGFTVLGVAVALVVLGLLPWVVTTDISLALTMAASIVILGWLAWAIGTGRAGLRRWEPTARRQRRLERRAAARAQAAALTQQQRLDAALSHGPYRPETAEPPASDERARARQELLEATEQHGGLSPQARAAAERAKRHHG
jgi:hypothetical protein